MHVKITYMLIALSLIFMNNVFATGEDGYAKYAEVAKREVVVNAQIIENADISKVEQKLLRELEIALQDSCEGFGAESKVAHHKLGNVEKRVVISGDEIDLIISGEGVCEPFWFDIFL